MHFTRPTPESCFICDIKLSTRRSSALWLDGLSTLQFWFVCDQWLPGLGRQRLFCVAVACSCLCSFLLLLFVALKTMNFVAGKGNACFETRNLLPAKARLALEIQNCCRKFPFFARNCLYFCRKFPLFLPAICLFLLSIKLSLKKNNKVWSEANCKRR